jgi:hypothetical protein
MHLARRNSDYPDLPDLLPASHFKQTILNLNTMNPYSILAPVALRAPGKSRLTAIASKLLLLLAFLSVVSCVPKKVIDDLNPEEPSLGEIKFTDNSKTRVLKVNASYDKGSNVCIRRTRIV